VIDDLIAETAGNIERGYAIEKSNATFGLQLCTSPSANFHFCSSTRSTAKRTPVVINPVVEQRKLSQLKAKRAVLLRQSEQRIADCKAAQNSG